MRKHRTLTLFVVSLLLILCFGIRMWQIDDVPGGFSQEELNGIRVIETIREGTVFVFFDIGDDQGIESVYYAMSVTLTRFQGTGLIGYRLFSVWLSMLTLALLFAVSRRLFGVEIGLLAMLMMGSSIYFTLLSRTATHHILLPFFSILTLWAVTQAFHLSKKLYLHQPTTFAYTLLGFSVALSTYAHPSGFLVGFAVLMFTFWLGRNIPNLSRDVWWNSSYALLFALILGLPYIVSVIRNLEISGIYVFWSQRPTSLVAFGESIVSTIAAFFWEGDANPAHNVPTLPIVQVLEPIFLIIGASVAIRRRHLPNYNLIATFFFLGLIPDIWIDGPADFRWFGVLMPAMYILLAVGIVESVRIVNEQQYFPENFTWAKDTQFLNSAILFLLTLGIGFNIFRSQSLIFNDWPQRQDTQFAYNTDLGDIALYLDRNGADENILVCLNSFEAVPLQEFEQPVSDAQVLDWMISQEDLGYRVANCQQSLVFIPDEKPMQVIFADADQLNLLPNDLLNWLRFATPRPDLLNENGITTLWEIDTSTAVTPSLLNIASFDTTFYPRDLSGNLEAAQLPLDFEGNLTFIGHEPLPQQEAFRPGDLIQVTTYWRVDAILDDDIGIFVRLHDIPQASPYTEINTFSTDATRLQPGDIVVQTGTITLPAQLRPHQYLLTLGLYEGLTVNQRQVYDMQDIPRGNYVLIDEPFQVQLPE